jgi:hypothetical protein
MLARDAIRLALVAIGGVLPWMIVRVGGLVDGLLRAVALGRSVFRH